MGFNFIFSLTNLSEKPSAMRQAQTWLYGSKGSFRCLHRVLQETIFPLLRGAFLQEESDKIPSHFSHSLLIELLFLQLQPSQISKDIKAISRKAGGKGLVPLAVLCRATKHGNQTGLAGRQVWNTSLSDRQTFWDCFWSFVLFCY